MPHLLQHQERRVPLVHMEHGGLQTDRLERPHAADPEHDLLADARIDVAAVKRIGDVAILRQYVLRNVGIQQVERDPSYIQFPHLDIHVAGGQLHRDFQVVALRVLHRDQRQRIEIVGRIALLLPPVRIEHLPEIPLLIEQPDAHQRVILVARRLQMIAGKDAQTARIHRQALGEAIFRGKIGDQLAVGRGRCLPDVSIESLASQFVQRQVARVGRRLVQSHLRHAAQHQHRVVSAVPP